MTKEELKDIIKECIMEMSSETDSNTEVVSEGLFGKKKVKLPKDMQLTYDDFQKASVFKKRLDEVMKYLEKEGADKKQLSNMVQTIYFGIVGNTFMDSDGKRSNMDTKKYEPKLTMIVPYIKKYDDKKDDIIRDMVITKESLEKMAAKGKELKPLQKAYKADLEKAIKMLQ